jgi:hypothetical protein
MDDTFRLDFDEDGHLCIIGRDGWREPICPECGQPIRYVLDMASFTAGYDSKLAHARCVWRKGGFRREERLAADDL